MRIIENGVEREATAEEIKAFEKRKEDAKLFIPETEADPFDELLDELENVSSVKDIKAVAKNLKAKRGGKK